MRVGLLTVIPAYLFIGVESEVLQNYDFGECKQFFFEGTPPKGFDSKDGGANIYVPICQKANGDPRYATYYDTGTKMPIFSAYKSEGSVVADGQSPTNNWFIEPGLCDPPAMSNLSMEHEEGCGIAGSFADQKQAINADFTGNWCDDYDRGPLNPDTHNGRNETKLATFTLTNAAPMFKHFISGTWNRVELAISKYVDTWCPKRPVPSCEAYHITGTGFDGGPRLEFSSMRSHFNPPHFVWTAVCVRLLTDNETYFMSFGVIGWNSQEDETEHLEFYSLEEFESRLKLLLRSEDLEMFPAVWRWQGCSWRYIYEPIDVQTRRNAIKRNEALRLQAILAELLPQHRTHISSSSAHAGFSWGNNVTYHAIAEPFSLKAPSISANSSSWASGVGDVLNQLKLTCDVRETKCTIGLSRKKRSANQDSIITVCPGLRSVDDRTIPVGGGQCLYGSKCRKGSSGGYECQVDQNGNTQPCCAPDSPCRKYGDENYYRCWTSDERASNDWAYCSPSYSSQTISGKACIDGHPCGLHGYSYHWCYTDYSEHWDYCCSPWYPCDDKSKCYTQNSEHWYYFSSGCTSLTPHSGGSRRRRALQATCPDGWTLFCQNASNRGSCSCVVYSGTDTRSWESARQSCKAQGADLASVHSRQEAEFLDELAGNSAKLPWIGLSRVSRGSDFKWSDNSPVDFLFWVPAAGHKNAGGANNCAYMITTAYMTAYVHGSSYAHTARELQWSHGRCENREPYFCKKPATVAAARELERSAEDCPEGWVRHCMPAGRHPKCLCYQYFRNQRQSWDAALETCKSHGGDLVSVHSMEQVNFLDTLTEGDPTAPWLGLFRENGQWLWSDKSSVDFTQWAPGEPNNPENEKTCAYMYSSGYYNVFHKSWTPIHKLVWNDDPCTVPQPFFCQRHTDPHTRRTWTCPENWERRCSGNKCKCYKSFHQPGVTWQAAADFCHNHHHGHLAAIKSEEENRLVAHMAEGSWAWTGLATFNGKLSWTDSRERSELDYASWSRQVLLPVWTKHAALCVKMGTDVEAIDDYMKWTMESCDSKNVSGFVCERRHPQVPACDHSKVKCPEGWVKSCLEPGLLSCYCYKKFLAPKTWESARQSCQEEGAYLISLESQNEELALLQIAKDNQAAMNPNPIGITEKIREKKCEASNCPKFWVGLGGQNQTWAHGEPIKYINWASGVNSTVVTECTYFCSAAAQWLRKSCTATMNYVCEKKAHSEGQKIPSPCL